jgi:chromodomain-helicase-DNA-binding protein 1
MFERHLTTAAVALTNEFDLSDANHEEKIKELHTQLEELMLRRLKRDVLTSLPTKSERILRVEMSALQTLFYKNILTKNFAGLIKSAHGNNNISLLNIGEYTWALLGIVADRARSDGA